jgi:hypothetical protein
MIELCCHVEDDDINDFVKKCGFVESNQLTKWYCIKNESR